jgi:hypothetical protein
VRLAQTRKLRLTARVGAAAREGLRMWFTFWLVRQRAPSAARRQ